MMNDGPGIAAPKHGGGDAPEPHARDHEGDPSRSQPLATPLSLADLCPGPVGGQERRGREDGNGGHFLYMAASSDSESCQERTVAYVITGNQDVGNPVVLPHPCRVVSRDAGQKTQDKLMILDQITPVYGFVVCDPVSEPATVVKLLMKRCSTPPVSGKGMAQRRPP
jgi:hypothetical protein